MVEIIQMIKANLISLTLPKMRKTLTNPYCKLNFIFFVNFIVLPRKKAEEKNEFIFPDRTNFLESVADVVQHNLEVIYFVSGPFHFSTVPHIVLF